MTAEEGSFASSLVPQDDMWEVWEVWPVVERSRRRVVAGEWYPKPAV